MMHDALLPILFFSAFGIIGVTLVVRGSRRSAYDVFDDLLPDSALERDCVDVALKYAREEKINFTDEFGKAGLFTEPERRAFVLRTRCAPLVSGLGAVLIKLFFIPENASLILPVTVIGIAIGYLYGRSRLSRLRERYIRSLEFYLPIVMERLVMAVQSGFDILAALNAIIELEKKDRSSTLQIKVDPVTRLLWIVHRLTERGLSFGYALRTVAGGIESVALRHAFIHLAVAYSEGGELVMPLKELSDSTQLYYQECVEEQIAKLPVKATMPLLCTFAGLILCFVTVPVMQLMHLTGQTMKHLQ